MTLEQPPPSAPLQPMAMADIITPPLRRRYYTILSTITLLELILLQTTCLFLITQTTCLSYESLVVEAAVGGGYVRPPSSSRNTNTKQKVKSSSGILKDLLSIYDDDAIHVYASEEDMTVEDIMEKKEKLIKRGITGEEIIQKEEEETAVEEEVDTEAQTGTDIRLSSGAYSMGLELPPPSYANTIQIPYTSPQTSSTFTPLRLTFETSSLETHGTASVYHQLLIAKLIEEILPAVQELWSVLSVAPIQLGLFHHLQL